MYIKGYEDYIMILNLKFVNKFENVYLLKNIKQYYHIQTLINSFFIKNIVKNTKEIKIL